MKIENTRTEFTCINIHLQSIRQKSSFEPPLQSFTEPEKENLLNLSAKAIGSVSGAFKNHIAYHQIIVYNFNHKIMSSRNG